MEITIDQLKVLAVFEDLIREYFPELYAEIYAAQQYLPDEYGE